MNILKKIYVSIILTFLAAPLVVIAGVSVNSPKRLLFPPEGFSLKWYVELFSEI
jgi:putative spermidine/putrescine transport system permease protein